ncbi:single-stranded DNA-binding protein [Desulfoprunum benzoelyticum]|uniref:Single-stranded DNA-binding protein n=1 Tax=Desulfoprunum benzoelyticum TaxID=1506996 RepID=A0A840UNH4_9BACT|nr:single-stranded DNA-binding protein [Desulfoprunum benzoelyticum]MBB5347185.1 single-stranded DNA-binding protein [Desulfoprunum benzoelyticum]MBM9530489.1 single-stranded DNA-binding protein [Desulfoprunum benzoelyticum]
MRDLNEFRFSGTVQRFDRIQTKTGMAMVSFSVLCWKERIRNVAFKALAEQTELSPGDRIEVRGHIQSTEWQDKDGNRRTGWQVIAHEISRAENMTGLNQGQPTPPARLQPARQSGMFPEERRPDTNEQFSYQGGPF